MNSKIFYFSGTGNSLALAREIADQIGAKNIINMAKFSETGFTANKSINAKSSNSKPSNAKISNDEFSGRKDDLEELNINEEVIGFVFPVYFQNIPEIVKEFIKKLNFKNNPYIFGIATCNGGPGFTLFRLDEILRSHKQKLSSGFAVTMPGNSVIILDLTSDPQVQKERLAISKTKVKEISKIIHEKSEAGIDGEDNIKYRLEGFFTRFISTKIYRAQKRFIATEKCTKCGTCQRICPHNNIKIGQNITWGNNCSLCLACYHWCPQNCVEIGNSTKNRIRYQHPLIKPKDMFLR